jgi:O-antigen/teichoic acid export membrane protein
VSDRRLHKNISASWLGLGTEVIVGVLLTPFVLHRIGATQFGIWVLVTAFTGYYGLLDLGTRNAITRFVARHNAQNDVAALNATVSTAFAAYLVVGTIALIVTTAAAFMAGWIFRIDASLVPTAVQVIVAVGIGTALGFPLSIFGGVLEGLQRFTTVGVVQGVMIVCRGLVIVAAVQRGGSVVAVAIITMTGNVLAGALHAYFAYRAYPELRIRVTAARRERLRELTDFGLVTFWIGIANRLRFQSDALVIGALIALSQVTTFAVAARLVTYATEIVATMASVFTPIFSDLHARNARDDLILMLQRGNLYSSFLAVPIAVAMVLLGRDVIHLWVGVGYEASAPLMIIIGIPMCAYVAQSASTRVLYGVAKHQFLAKVLLCEGIANLVLSCALAPRLGLLGVALGTAMPLLVTSCVVIPIHVSETLEIPIREYCISFIAPVLAGIPLVVFWMLTAARRESALTALPLLLTMLGGGLVYVGGFALLIKSAPFLLARTRVQQRASG